MKRSFIIFGIAIILGYAGGSVLKTVKAHSEQRLERIDQEIEERINGMREECRLQFPHDIYMRAKCYQKMMANV